MKNNKTSNIFKWLWNRIILFIKNPNSLFIEIEGNREKHQKLFWGIFIPLFLIYLLVNGVFVGVFLHSSLVIGSLIYSILAVISMGLFLFSLHLMNKLFGGDGRIKEFTYMFAILSLFTIILALPIAVPVTIIFLTLSSYKTMLTLGFISFPFEVVLTIIFIRGYLNGVNVIYNLSKVKAFFAGLIGMIIGYFIVLLITALVVSISLGLS